MTQADRELAELIDSIPAKKCKWWKHRWNQWSEPVSAAHYGGWSIDKVQVSRCIDCGKFRKRSV